MSVKVYQIITDRIIRQLEEGVAPWRKEWQAGLPKNLVSGKEYRGINLMLLAEANCEYFVTKKQASALGGRIRCKGYPVIYWNIIEKEDPETGEIKSIPFLRYYRVYPVSGVEGIEDPECNNRDNPVDAAEQVIEGMPDRPVIEYGGDRACYIPARDMIRLPARSSFYSIEGFYSTAFHELVHSTGHASRLNRKGIAELEGYGTHSYSEEELVAEMGAAFLSGYCGILNQTLENSAAYISHWIGALKADPKLIVQIGARAQKAVDYILGATDKDPG